MRFLLRRERIFIATLVTKKEQDWENIYNGTYANCVQKQYISAKNRYFSYLTP